MDSAPWGVIVKIHASPKNSKRSLSQPVLPEAQNMTEHISRTSSALKVRRKPSNVGKTTSAQNPDAAIFLLIAHQLLDEIHAGTKLDKKELLHQVFHRAELLLDEKFFSNATLNGRKAALSSTLEMLDASIRCFQTFKKKVRPKSYK